MMPTLDDFLAYLGQDFADDDMVNINATRSLHTAIEIVHGSVGPDVEVYLPGDPRVRELVLIYAEDLFNQRGLAAKVSNATRRLVSAMENQLVLELRRKKREA
jgi:hypothetical protein